ncbi:hypothetical protein PUNSTDRAFT_117326 [Punctularia strigosozonata HHB-11173 SS5]|uniref:uncharacterized protein n=1 Tax=Punctularia strigosozonata (strain HHB-11173) TaxID=741275 RepID=UPI0004417D50|nr:uncharacterized protein PUNSTDRAFT_117326 [Punctularia strigosozonata HHB-11173 SS5]EIN13598.1 hypothetical protein PUNSTDRAFT_117326 [Punctularia strigosozonata HHB-11173 SS5]
MPPAVAYPAQPDYLSPYPQDPSESSHEGDYKASYEDLIDEHDAPYSKTTGHQTIAIDPTTAAGHRRGPSYPLSHQPTYSSEFNATQESVPRKGVEWGYPPSPPQRDKEKPSIWSQLVPDSLACKLYVLTVLIETIIDLAIEGDLLLRVHEAKKDGEGDSLATRKMPVYLSVFVFAHVFQLVMAIDAVYARNTLQFISLTLFNALFLFYAVIQIGEIKRAAIDTNGIAGIPIQVLTTIIPIVISVAEIAYIALGWKIYNEFGWKVYKFLGADRTIKRIYATYQIFICLVKFDLFFWVGFSVQFIWLILQKTDWEYYVTVAALPLSIILLIEGHLAARHENKWMMFTFMSGCVGALVYFFYKLVRVLSNRTESEFVDVWASLTTFSIIAILLLIITFVFACLVLNNYGRGLKEQLAKSSTHTRWGSQSVSHRPMSANPNRMSID